MTDIEHPLIRHAMAPEAEARPYFCGTCFFHTPNCRWARARRLAGDMSVRVEGTS